MFCSECGKEINNDVKFCPFCGLKILEIKEKSENLNKENQQPNKYSDSSSGGFSFGEISLEIKNNFDNLSKSEANEQSKKDLDKFVNNVSKVEFNKLNNANKRKLILSEIKGEDYLRAFHPFGLKINIPGAGFRYSYLNKVLRQFDEGSYRDGRLYKILIEREFLPAEDENPNKYLLGNILRLCFILWITNTVLANILDFKKDSEQWNIPILSTITPVYVQEISVMGEGKYRFASQAEVWRTNRRFKKIKENINNIDNFDLNEFENNLKRMLD